LVTVSLGNQAPQDLRIVPGVSKAGYTRTSDCLNGMIYLRGGCGLFFEVAMTLWMHAHQFRSYDLGCEAGDTNLVFDVEIPV